MSELNINVSLPFLRFDFYGFVSLVYFCKALDVYYCFNIVDLRHVCAVHHHSYIFIRQLMCNKLGGRLQQLS